jgi:fructose-1,6-bisphosphatase
MYIIGDIHGCFLTLQKLVEKIGKDEVFYSVGDIVDKGPDTCKTLDFVMSLKNFKMVLGNHEVQFINHIKRYINNEDISNTNWYKNFGGKQSIDSYNYLNNKEEDFKDKHHGKQHRKIHHHRHDAASGEKRKETGDPAQKAGSKERAEKRTRQREKIR